MAASDRSRLFETPEAYFNQNGSTVMKLTADAARAVCRQASSHGLVVVRIEGGIWHSPGFEARLDCIWDGEDPPLTTLAAQANNKLAEGFIAGQPPLHDAFVVTTAPVMGYLHKRS